MPRYRHTLGELASGVYNGVEKESMADTSQRRRFLQCPKCGAENLPLNKYCGQCGAPLRDGGVAQTALPSKAGSLLPYSPGLRGPGTGARLALAGTLILLLACVLLTLAFLSSGADRTPARPTSTPVSALVTVY